MESPDKKRFKFSIGYLILAFWGLMLAQQLLSTHASTTDLSYTDFKSAIRAGRVADVSIAPTVIHGHLKAEGAPEGPAAGSLRPPAPAPAPASPPSGRAEAARGFDTMRGEDPGLLAELERQGVRVTGVGDNSFWRDTMSWLLPVGLLLIFGGIVSRRLAQG